MLRTRIIPALLLRNESLVKTVRFGKFTYVGDPCNTVRIFNELEVDELLFLDITATREGRSPNLKVLTDIANECFMPLAYGGGIRCLEDAKAIVQIGFEKIVINSHAIENPMFITQLADHLGSQAVIVSIDVKRSFWGKEQVRTNASLTNTRCDPGEWAKSAETLGAGEILLTSIDREGSWDGFDINLIKRVTSADNQVLLGRVEVPVEVITIRDRAVPLGERDVEDFAQVGIGESAGHCNTLPFLERATLDWHKYRETLT